MSNPFNSPSLTGYNASPPADDGTQAASNQVEWDKHINKIGDPLKTYAAAISAAALAAHGLAFGAAVLAKTANYTVTTSDRGRFITVTGASTITLPASADAGEGFPVAVINIGGDVVTVDGDSSETINGSTSITLLPGDYAILTSSATTWAAAGIFSTLGSFTPTFTGFSADPSTPNINYVKRGNIITLDIEFGTGTSNSSQFTISNLPSDAQPFSSLDVPCVALVDAGVDIWGFVGITGATMTFYAQGDSSGWTPSGNKGFKSGTATQIIYPHRTE